MFNKTDFNLPLDQHIEKINQLIEKTEDLIQYYHDFCDYQQLPLKLKRELKEWPSKFLENCQKFREFKIEWNNFYEVYNNFYGFDNAPTCGILDEEIVSELEHRLGKLKFYAGILKARKELISERENASSQVCNLQPSSSLDADPVKSCLTESENHDATQPANHTCLEESGNTDATDLEPDSQTMKATDQDTSQPAVSGTMKIDWETTPTDSQQTGSLDNGVINLKNVAKDKCEIFSFDWGKNHNKDYKTFRDKIYNYTTWKFKEKRRATVDLLLIFLIMLGRWMRDGIHNHEIWDTQSYKRHRYVQWNNDFKTGHDKKLFGYLTFKFKTCQPFLGLILFR